MATKWKVMGHEHWLLQYLTSNVYQSRFYPAVILYVYPRYLQLSPNAFVVNTSLSCTILGWYIFFHISIIIIHLVFDNRKPEINWKKTPMTSYRFYLLVSSIRYVFPRRRLHKLVKLVSYPFCLYEQIKLLITKNLVRKNSRHLVNLRSIHKMSKTNVCVKIIRVVSLCSRKLCSSILLEHIGENRYLLRTIGWEVVW